MSSTDLERIEAELVAIKDALVGHRPRVMHSIPQAAQRLGVGLTKLRELVKTGEVLTRPLGGREMVTEAEIQRLAGEPVLRRRKSPSPARLDLPASPKIPPKPKKLAAKVVSLEEGVEAFLKARRKAKKP